jgi:hypothetical protein
METPVRKGGRPSKLTPEVQEKLCTAIRGGNFLDTAAAYAGVHRDTLREWLRRGARASSGIYRAFLEAVEKAHADAEARDVALIAKAAAGGNWQAAGWRLERRFPERWARRSQCQVEANVNHTMKGSADDAIQQLTRLLAAETAEGEEGSDP